MKLTTQHIATLTRQICCTLAFIALALGFVSCGDDQPSGTLPHDGWYDMVTLSSMTNTGSIFSLQKDGDSDVITYTTPYTLAKDTLISIGDRLIIMYLRADGAPAYTSGAIDLYGYRRLDNVPQRVITDDRFDEQDWPTEPIDVLTLTRTGSYINMQARMSCHKAEGAEQWQLVADAATLTDAYPQLYVVYKAKSPGENYAMGYASWNISQIWDAPACAGVQIRYLSPEGIVTETISK